MLRRMALVGGTVFFVVPFVALAEEKTRYFQHMWGDMHIGIRPFHGEQTMSVLTSDVDVAVCTIEKANSLLNQILDEGRHELLSMLIVDEIHMLEDSHRGFLLEVLLSKIKFLLPTRVQIVGMSATLPNMADLSTWLQAQLYKTDYRPVSLAVKVCMGTDIYRPGTEGGVTTSSTKSAATSISDNNHSSNSKLAFDTVFNHERGLPHPSSYGLEDTTSAIALLCLETVIQRKSIIVFCSSKRNCELQAEIIAQCVYHYYQQQAQNNNNTSSDNDGSGNNGSNGNEKREGKDDTAQHTPDTPHLTSSELREIRRNRILLMESLRQTQAGLHRDLRVPIQYGVAFHHAGLMGEQRKLIEEAFHK